MKIAESWKKQHQKAKDHKVLDSNAVPAISYSEFQIPASFCPRLHILSITKDRIDLCNKHFAVR